jgi:hypothetical protein
MHGCDKVGNQMERPDVTIAYTPFDLPQKYTRKADGAETLLEYDGDQTRVRKTTAIDETLYFGDYERVTPRAAPSSVEHRYAVWSDERIVAIVTQKNLQPAGVPGSRTYLHVDHLGSTEKVTDAAGVILERRSYDAFGARRNPDWTQETLRSASRGTTLGYTGVAAQADGWRSAHPGYFPPRKYAREADGAETVIVVRAARPLGDKDGRVTRAARGTPAMPARRGPRGPGSGQSFEGAPSAVMTAARALSSVATILEVTR